MPNKKTQERERAEGEGAGSELPRMALREGRESENQGTEKELIGTEEKTWKDQVKN